jgi:hypothetical protein
MAVPPPVVLSFSRAGRLLFVALSLIHISCKRTPRASAPASQAAVRPVIVVDAGVGIGAARWDLAGLWLLDPPRPAPMVSIQVTGDGTLEITAIDPSAGDDDGPEPEITMADLAGVKRTRPRESAVRVTPSQAVERALVRQPPGPFALERVTVREMDEETDRGTPGKREWWISIPTGRPTDADEIVIVAVDVTSGAVRGP